VSRRRLVAGALVGLAVAGAAVVVAARRPERSAASVPPVPPVQTARVARTDLADSTEVDGTLGYDGSVTVTGAGRGTLTWLPTPGATVRRGQRLYGVDARPVPLLIGDLPLYRPLHTGVPDGPDVRVLEQNLAALGYGDGLAVDETFSAATAAAVKAWQHDLGLAETGALGPGDAVVLPAAVRIASVAAQLGAPAQGSLLTVTRTTRSVTVNLPVAQQELASRGARVQVELPDGRLVPGTVASIGTAVTSGSGNGSGDGTGNGNGSGNGSQTIAVTIRLTDQHAAGRLDSAPVQVHFISGTRRGVLAVPVGALLALREGGYAVEVVDAGQRHLVGVRTGLFANGLVEVSGVGVRAGQIVVVAS